MKAILLALSLGFLSGMMARATEIPVISVDPDGTSVVRNIPEGQYLEGLRSVLSSVSEVTLSRLDSKAFAQSCEIQPEARGWNLRAIAIGIGARVSAGLGPLIGGSARASMRMVYNRHEVKKGGGSHAKI